MPSNQPDTAIDVRVIAWLMEHPGPHTAHEVARGLGIINARGVHATTVTHSLGRLEALRIVKHGPGLTDTGRECVKWEGTWGPGETLSAPKSRQQPTRST